MATGFDMKGRFYSSVSSSFRSVKNSVPECARTSLSLEQSFDFWKRASSLPGVKQQIQLIHFIAGLALCLSPALHARGEIQLLAGAEGAIREPDGNKDQAWLGIGYMWEERILNYFQPYGRALVGDDYGDYLLTAGLAFSFQPLEELEDLRLGIQTGPAYTNVGRPHTGSRYNWTTDAWVRYRIFQLGYSHTSNGGIDSPNSGLDLVTFGIILPFDF